MRFFSKFIAFPALSLATSLLPAVSQAADTPEPPAGAKELRYFVGNWTGKGKVKFGNTTSQVTATYRCKDVSLGWGVACDLEVKGIDGFPRYVLTSIWGFDQGSATYHWYAVSNGGEVHDHAGRLSADKTTVTLEHRELQGGKPFVEKLVLKCDGERKFQIDVHSTLAGEPVETSQLVFER